MKGEMAEVIPITVATGLEKAVNNFNAFLDELPDDRRRIIMEAFLKAQFREGQFQREKLTVQEIAFLLRMDKQYEYSHGTVRIVMNGIRALMEKADFADLIWISHGYRFDQQGSPAEYSLGLGIEPRPNHALVLTQEVRLALKRASEVISKALDEKSPEQTEDKVLLQAREAALKGREEAISAKERALFDWDQKLNARESAFDAREAALAGREAALHVREKSENKPEAELVPSTAADLPSSEPSHAPSSPAPVERLSSTQALKDLQRRLIMPDDPAAFRSEAERISTRASILRNNLLSATCRGQLFPLKQRSPSAVEHLRRELEGTRFVIKDRIDGSFLALRDESDEKRMLAVALNVLEAAQRGKFNSDRVPGFFGILVERSREDPTALKKFANLCRYPILIKPALEALSGKYPELHQFLDAMEAVA